jgi:hypothetical protein
MRFSIVAALRDGHAAPPRKGMLHGFVVHQVIDRISAGNATGLAKIVTVGIRDLPPAFHHLLAKFLSVSTRTASRPLS